MPENPWHGRDSGGQRVAYVSKEFPGLTTTFDYRKVQTMCQLSVVVRSISTWRPKAVPLSAEAAPFVDESFYFFPLPRAEWAKTHRSYLWR